MTAVAGLKKSSNTKKRAGFAVVVVGIYIYMRKKKSPAKGVLEKVLSFISSGGAESVLIATVGGM